IPAFHLVGDIIWTPCEYLTIIMPSVAKVLDKKGVAAVLSYRSFLFEQQSEMLVKEAQAQVLKVGDWCEEMRTTLEAWPKTNIVAQLERRTRLFLRGVRSAELIGRLLKTVLNGHLAEHRTMARTSAQGLFRLIELIKAIEATFARHWSAVVESCNHICQHWTGALLKLVSSGRETLRTDKGYTDERVDMLSALVVVEQALAGPVTKERWYILNLALNLACYTKLFRPNDVTDMENLVGHLWTVSTLGRALERVSDCSFLYWHRSLLPVYFESLIHDSAECQRVVYFFDAINDSTKIIDAVRHAPTSVALEYFQREIFTVFEQSFLTKLCETIETDLRLSIHTHLQLNDRNPFKTNDAVHISPILKVPPLRIRDEFIDIQRYVEHYLEKTFYNLTTVALHDWKTYAEMRQLARQKYGLALAETHLPSQTLEQGLDVLVIMRNIHIFVAGYNYNLNTQCFVQKESRNKHLNTLNTRHITNSIRTHGTGIMNTTVNFTYQFLKKKFYIFSQFLYDDHIKSQLIKDARYFRDNMDQLERMYPIERAEKFNRGIRKLGVTGDGLTFLDQFRIVITQIGNALGFVRLVRAGGLQACSQAIHFIPDLDDIVSLAPLVEQAHLSTETLQAAQIFDTLVSDLVKNFAEGTEYFKLLVDVFAPEFRNFEKYSHLKNFYMIVPPLTVNFVEHILACKERIGKKSQQGEITFTDDGFCMGIAYILKLLDQYEDLDSLHWFQSVMTKCHAEKTKALNEQREGKTGVGKDEKLVQTLSLKTKRLNNYKREFDLVAFALRSARIFFRTDVENEIIPREKDAASDAISVKSSSNDAAS
uniref:WASH complex subunit 7 n=1 Tax=Plectus sambesii TaxID=2011161 RepID=A0A914VWE5_9BILA